MNMHVEMPMGGEIAQSYVEMGLAFSAGRAGSVDLIEAHKWFNIAAARGDRSAARLREELASEMSREQIAAALRAARQFLSCH